MVRAPEKNAKGKTTQEVSGGQDRGKKIQRKTQEDLVGRHRGGREAEIQNLGRNGQTSSRQKVLEKVREKKPDALREKGIEKNKKKKKTKNLPLVALI